MKIAIVWENNRPYFMSDDKKGDCVLLQFVWEYIDDIDLDGERFFVFLQKGEAGWKAKIDDKLSYGTLHKDLVHELIAEINFALEARGAFEMIEYVASNKHSDAFFSFFVCWIEKYRPAPPGISRLVR